MTLLGAAITAVILGAIAFLTVIAPRLTDRRNRKPRTVNPPMNDDQPRIEQKEAP